MKYLQYHDNLCICCNAYCMSMKYNKKFLLENKAKRSIPRQSFSYTPFFSFSHRHALLVSVRTEQDHQSCCPANGELCVCHSEVNHSQLGVVLWPVLRASRSGHPSHQSPNPGIALPAYTSSGLRYRAVICSWTQHSTVTLPARMRVWPRRAACFWPGMENKSIYRTFGRRCSQGQEKGHLRRKKYINNLHTSVRAHTVNDQSHALTHIWTMTSCNKSELRRSVACLPGLTQATFTHTIPPLTTCVSLCSLWLRRENKCVCVWEHAEKCTSIN